MHRRSGPSFQGSNFSKWFRRNPVVAFLICSSAAAYLAAWLGAQGIRSLSFSGFSGPLWTFITYPWAALGEGYSFVWFLFSLYILWWSGSDIERRMTSGRFAAVITGYTVLGAVLVGAGGQMFAKPVFLYGIELLVAFALVAWAAKNRSACIRIFMCIPVPAWLIAVITILSVMFGMGTGAPVIGVLAALPLIFLWFWASDQIPVLSFDGRAAKSTYGIKTKKEVDKERKQFEGYIDSVRAKEKEREEKERLRKLFESSLDDEK